MLVYRYFNDDDTLIQTENVPVVKDGAKGDAGEQGGAYYGTTQPSKPNLNDYYLDTVQMKLFWFNGSEWVEDENVTPPDYRWNTAVADCIATANASGNVLTASKAWIGNLVANTALIQQLFAKEITLLDGGLIKSENYSESSIKEDDEGKKYIDTENYSDTGWAIDNKGTSDFVNIHATGGIFNSITLEKAKVSKGLDLSSYTAWAFSAYGLVELAQRFQTLGMTEGRNMFAGQGYVKVNDTFYIGDIICGNGSYNSTSRVSSVHLKMKMRKEGDTSTMYTGILTYNDSMYGSNYITILKLSLGGTGLETVVSTGTIQQALFII